MEYSEKYNFYLPSRDGDDIADINQISDNFRIIEENIPSKKDLDDAVSDATVEVDQTYNPNSPNAQSGIAVAEAITLFDKSKQKNFEQIATIKVSADENGNLPTSIVFSTDSEGNTFKLTDFCLTMKVGATDGSNARVVLQVNDLNVFGYANIVLSATSLSAWYIDYIDLGAAKLCIAPAQTVGTVLVPNINLNTFIGGIVPAVTPRGYNYEPITKIRFYIIAGTEKTFISGSEFNLYGVRK